MALEGSAYELLLDYRVLREALFTVVECDEPLDAEARNAVLNVLHDAMAEAVEEFTHAHVRRLQEARDEFLSVATHELRSPISSILLGVQLLKKTVDRNGSITANDAHRLLEPSLRQLGRLTQMVDTLLDVSRLGQGRLQLDCAMVDLAALAQDVVARLRELARASGSPIELAADDAVRGWWDRLRLEQVFTNLLTNAIKYGDGQPIAVRVSKDATGGLARIEVLDRGIGIAREDQKRIFERYERVGTSHDKNSLGVGLYIVREIVNAHGGVVRVDSAVAAGSRFAVELPLDRRR